MVTCADFIPRVSMVLCTLPRPSTGPYQHLRWMAPRTFPVQSTGGSEGAPGDGTGLGPLSQRLVPPVVAAPPVA